MVNIIERGLKPSDREYRVTCRVCDTVFEFFGYEANYHQDERDSDFYTICCPVCDSTVSQSVDNHK